MKKIHTYCKAGLFITATVFLLLSACKKDNYYIDGGKANPVFKGNILEYLQSKPFYFDTLVNVIKLAGLDSTFTKDTITFFAPPDLSVKKLILNLNKSLFIAGKDTVKTLDEIPKEIWAKYLKLYIFKGARTLKDYPQLDFNLKNRYGGQNFISYSGVILNIGATFSDVSGVKYVGYRQLTISYIPNTAMPFDNWITTMVSSSDIQPNNGVVHVLNGYNHNFGFDTQNLIQEVLLVR